MRKDEANQKLRALREKRNAVILGIETSCDETAAAIVQNGRTVRSNALYTQIAIHAKYGGVVPEIASRNHVEKLPYIVDEALVQAGLRLQDVDALAVTHGPGLVGALLTGVSYAKALSYAAEKPLIAVNHIEGHISANYISHPSLEPPFMLALLPAVSMMAPILPSCETCMKRFSNTVSMTVLAPSTVVRYAMKGDCMSVGNPG